MFECLRLSLLPHPRGSGKERVDPSDFFVVAGGVDSRLHLFTFGMQGPFACASLCGMYSFVSLIDVHSGETVLNFFIVDIV